MTSPFLLQLAGPPGVGKSALAAEVSRRTGAVVLDADTVKSTLLDCGVDWTRAGQGGYASLAAIAEDLLRRGNDVVLDSASHYPKVPENGLRAAAAASGRYYFVELQCDDLSLLGDRLAARGQRRKRSQMPNLDTRPPDADRPTTARRTGTHAWAIARPPGPVITVQVSAVTRIEDVADAVVPQLRG